MKWYKKYLDTYDKPYNQLNDEMFKLVSCNLKRFQSDFPIATVAIITHNDETRLLTCIWSLSQSKSKYPIEIIGVNNASTDNSETIFKRVGLKYFVENRKGFGFARQCGLVNARGKYYICIDSDTLYPEKYIDKVIDTFEKYKVVGVNATYDILYQNYKERIFFLFYGFLKSIYNRISIINRPELAIRGSVFSHNTELGKKIGYRVDIKSGSDGSMAFELMKYGKIKFLRNRKIRPLTVSSVFPSSSNMFLMLVKKINSELVRFHIYFKRVKEIKDDESNLMN